MLPFPPILADKPRAPLAEPLAESVAEPLPPWPLLEPAGPSKVAARDLSQAHGGILREAVLRAGSGVRDRRRGDGVLGPGTRRLGGLHEHEVLSMTKGSQEFSESTLKICVAGIEVEVGGPGANQQVAAGPATVADVCGGKLRVTRPPPRPPRPPLWPKPLPKL